MVRFHSTLLSACDRAAQTISRTALLSMGLLMLATSLDPLLGDKGGSAVASPTASPQAAPAFQPFANAPVLPRPHPVAADTAPALPTLTSNTTAASRTDFTPFKLAAVEAVPLLRATSAPLRDGTYLFGESSLAHQIDKAYMVFQVEGKKVSGAVYWPQSSYDCFEGRFNQGRLALRVKAAYSGEVYERSLAVVPDASAGVVASDGAIAAPGLEGMHRFEAPAEADLEILATCQAIW